MKTWRKFIVIVLSLLIFITLVTFIPMLITPRRRPVNMVRNYILRITPIGTNIEDVIKVIESRDDWGGASVDYERGFYRETASRPPLPGVEPLFPVSFSVIGEMSVSAGIGRYRSWHNLFFIDVIGVGVTWGFDGDGNLIEVHVRKGGGP